MSRWWRAYEDALHDPKVLALSDRLHRAWFNLLCVASKNGGTLPAMNVVAIELRITPTRAREYVSGLVDAGLLDEVSHETYAPHNWNARQFKSDVSTERVKRFRKQQGNVSSTVSETPPETDTEADTEPSLRSGNARAPARDADFADFWKAFPNKVGKNDARKAFDRAIKSGSVTLAQIAVGLHAYINKTDDRPWCNPATWLNQGRWDDQPATVTGNGKSVLSALDRLEQQLSRGDDNSAGQADLLSLPAR